MRPVYLRSTERDFAWLQAHYSRVFPEGDKRAREQLRAVARLLCDNPLIGKPGVAPDVRELVIPRTPFSLIYRVSEDRIEVLRIWDDRADRSGLGDEI